MSRLYGIAAHRPEPGVRGPNPESTNLVAMVFRVAAKPVAGATRRLVIVESPAKAKTIAGYLGADYVVESSIGHIRDLPNRASDVPKEQARGVRDDRRRDRVRLRAALPRRRGQEAARRRPEAQAQGRRRALPRDGRGPRGRGDRLAPARGAEAEGAGPADGLPRDHEATRSQRALGETRDIDQRLVDAQETRRILDRLYGYEVSPVLWKKVMPGLSAGPRAVGRGAARRRARARAARFVSAGYWDIQGPFDPGAFKARLVAVDGKRVAQGRDFAQDGTLKPKDAVVLDEAGARGLAEQLAGSTSRSAPSRRSRTRGARRRRS